MRNIIPKKSMALLKEAREMFEETGCLPDAGKRCFYPT
jgi:hypothetical protein